MRLKTCLRREPIGTESGATAGNVVETANGSACIQTPRIKTAGVQLPRTIPPRSTMIAMGINLRISVSLMVRAPGRGHHLRRDPLPWCTVRVEVSRFFLPPSLVPVPRFHSSTPLMLLSMKSDDLFLQVHFSAVCKVLLLYLSLVIVIRLFCTNQLKLCLWQYCSVYVLMRP